MSRDKPCQRCSSARVAHGGGKCSDMFSASVGSRHKHGYAPSGMGVGGGDYVELSWCLDCGQLQGTWPLPPCELEGPGPCGDEREIAVANNYGPGRRILKCALVLGHEDDHCTEDGRLWWPRAATTAEEDA